MKRTVLQEAQYRDRHHWLDMRPVTDTPNVDHYFDDALEQCRLKRKAAILRARKEVDS